MVDVYDRPTGPAGPALSGGLPDPVRGADRLTPVGSAAPATVAIRGWQDRFAQIVGRVLLAAALWSLISLVLRPVRALHWVDDAFSLVNLPVSPSLFSVVLLGVLGGAARRRIRLSLSILLLFQALALVELAIVIGVVAFTSVTAQDIGDIDWALLVVSALISAALLVLLWRSRPAFPSRLERGARWRALAILVVGLACSIALSLALTFTFPRTLDSPSRKALWAARTAVGLEPNASDPGWSTQRGYQWIALLVGLLSALALAAAATTFLRSARAKAYLTAQDELEVRRLLLASGERDSLGYFATRHDKSVIFDSAHQAAVTYRVVAAVSLASADPIGSPGHWRPAIDAWLAEARRFGWFPAVLSASAEGARAYVAAGLKALPLGDEAIIETDAFSLEDPRLQPIRRAVHKVQRAGYRITIKRHAELGPADFAELDDVAQRWRGDDTERGFSMALNRIGDPADGSCVAVYAHDAQGQLRAALSFVPWGRRGLSLDLMRRDPTSENGVIEAMVAALIAGGRDELGVRRISLNFAMFRGVFSAAERVGAGPLVRLTNRALIFASRFWQLESLYRSNDRYVPQWTRRYLCYDSSLTVSRVALAAGIAEGFLPGAEIRVERPEDGQVEFHGQSMQFEDAVAELQRELTRTVRPVQRLTQQQRVRRGKLDRLAAAGLSGYPVSVPRTADLPAVRACYAGLPADSATGARVSVVGRVRALRDFGGVAFAVLQEDGATLQALFDLDRVGRERHRLFRTTVDLGDHISVTGEVGTSHTGELSVLVDDWCMAGKCLRPLPDVHAGFADQDARVRQRHLDLIVNRDAREMVLKRSTAVRAIRDGFVRRGYSEVETPMLQAVHGGANARPFVTHINAYDMTLYLRIAPELFLKRLCVGGLQRVFELNRNFRNEGADATHNPEFTSVEAYEAHGDYLTMRELTRELILETAIAVHGRPVACRPQPDGSVQEVDLSGSWRSVTVHEAVSRASGAQITPDTSLPELDAICRRVDVRVPPDPTPGLLVAELYDQLVEKQTVLPTFYLDFPVETSPLTRIHRHDSRLAERWDLVAFGAELGTAYSELVDPLDQRERLTEQSLRAADGDPEAMQLDEAFLSALEYAMPPTGGLGIGVDRLVMTLMGASIRQTLAFPFVRPGGR